MILMGGCSNSRIETYLDTAYTDLQVLKFRIKVIRIFFIPFECQMPSDDEIDNVYTNIPNIEPPVVEIDHIRLEPAKHIQTYSVLLEIVAVIEGDMTKSK
jgi:hypothetical protein